MNKVSPWTVMKIVITIQFDEEGNPFDVNYSDGYRSISYDPQSFLPTLSMIINEFNY